MTKEEFIRTCALCGYASIKNARKYAKDKETLTEDDFEKVFSMNERQNDLKHGLHNYCSKSGDMLIDALNDRPEPWNHVFDASRGIDIEQIRRGER